MKGESKVCAVCGRSFEWRKKWEKNWAEVRYCSDACRGRKADARDDRIEHEILKLLEQRAATASCCPSDVAKLLGPGDFRPWMQPVREAAGRLVAAGRLEVTQGGRVVDLSKARGAIRLRLKR